MIGYVAVIIACILSIVVAGLYFMVSGNPAACKSKSAKIAAKVYVLSTVFIGTAVFYLGYIILNDNFSFAYVAGYSSRELPLLYKVSAVWAGQEGSFLVWLLFQALFGLAILRRSVYSAGVMRIYALLQTVLLFIVFVKSPFMMLAEAHADGAGLNPLLQDPWMVLHPPVVFLGYAALVVPFAYAFDGLLTGRHREWPALAKSWLLLALSSLGAGIFVGGFWAYKVLGWGGYWAWDPVENSSLVPWLAAGAALHMLSAAKTRPGAIRIAYVGVLSSYLAVLYGTFLTRSGIVSNFSTHSFADEGIGGLLGGIVLLIAAVTFLAYIIKLPAIPSGELYQRIASMEYLAVFTAMVLAVFGVIVFIGMSTPLVTMAFATPQSVSAAFYNRAVLPLTTILAAVLAAKPLLERYGEVRVYWCAGLSAVLGIALVLWLSLLQQLLIAVTLCLAVTAAVLQLQAIGSKGANRAAACCHLGAAALVIGILASGAGSQSTRITFIKDQPQQVLGEQLTYAGTDMDSSGRAILNSFHIGSDTQRVQSLTKLNMVGEPAAREPGIYRRLLSDLYIAPIMKEQADRPELALTKGVPLTQGNIQLEFVKVTMTGAGFMPVGVETSLRITEDGRSEEIRPQLTRKNGQVLGSTVTALGRYEIHLVGISPAEGKVYVEVKDMYTDTVDDTVQLEVEVSRKPLISLVWLGAFLITLGTGWAWLQSRLAYARKASEGRNVLG